MNVNIVVPWNLANLKGRKVGAIHRFAFYLRKRLGWPITNKLRSGAVNYVFEYVDAWKTEADPWRKYREWAGPLACYFTHQEPTGIKHRLWRDAAKIVDLRVAQSARVAKVLGEYGRAVQAAIPVERKRFCLAPRTKASRPLIGVSGYCPISGRKGQSLVYELAHYPLARSWKILAAGRKWPVPTTMFKWCDLPRFYQQLDVYLCPSLCEGGPLGVFEALSCGTPVVVPQGVGALDELPDMPGIYRYAVGDFDAMYRALHWCIKDLGAHDREALRATTEHMTVEAFCEDHRQAFEIAFGEEKTMHSMPAWAAS